MIVLVCDSHGLASLLLLLLLHYLVALCSALLFFCCICTDLDFALYSLSSRSAWSGPMGMWQIQIEYKGLGLR